MLTLKAAADAIAPRLALTAADLAEPTRWLGTRQPIDRATNSHSWRVIAEAMTRAIMVHFALAGTMTVQYLAMTRELARILDRRYEPKTETAVINDVKGKWSMRGLEPDIVEALDAVVHICKELDTPMMKPAPTP
jgi:hypothetical protein